MTSCNAMQPLAALSLADAGYYGVAYFMTELEREYVSVARLLGVPRPLAAYSDAETYYANAARSAHESLEFSPEGNGGRLMHAVDIHQWQRTEGIIDNAYFSAAAARLMHGFFVSDRAARGTKATIDAAFVQNVCGRGILDIYCGFRGLVAPLIRELALDPAAFMLVLKRRCDDGSSVQFQRTSSLAECMPTACTIDVELSMLPPSDEAVANAAGVAEQSLWRKVNGQMCISPRFIAIEAAVREPMRALREVTRKAQASPSTTH